MISDLSQLLAGIGYPSIVVYSILTLTCIFQFLFGEPSILLVRMSKGAATLENGLAVSQTAKHRITIRPNNTRPRYVSKILENIFPHQRLYMSVQ